jgi:hypothetical protein
MSMKYNCQPHRLFAIAATLVAFCLNVSAQQQGAVTFANNRSCPVKNGATRAPVTVADGFKAALFVAELGSNNFSQVGDSAPLGYPVAGIFAAGTRVIPTSNTVVRVQVRAWPNAYATYKDALSHRARVGASAVIQVPLSDLNSQPAIPPASLTANGLQGFTIALPEDQQISVTFTNGNTVISFAGMPEQNYVIQYAPGVGGPWTDLADSTGVDPTAKIACIDGQTPCSSRFYRVVIQP